MKNKFKCKECKIYFYLPDCRLKGDNKWTGDFCSRNCRKENIIRSKKSKCLICKKEFISRQAPSRDGFTKYCSRNCWNIKSKQIGSELTAHMQNKICRDKANLKKKQANRIGVKSPAFKRGLTMGVNGYLIISSAIYGKNNIGKTYHRYLIEKEQGGVIQKGHHVHHVDGNKLNNDLTNLIVLTAGEHSTLHHKGKPKLRRLSCT